MNRWVSFTLCLIAGLVLLGIGSLIPAHLRAVDVAVIKQAGRATPGVVDYGLVLVAAGKPGPAQVMLEAAQQQNVAGWDKLRIAIAETAKQHPSWVVWGIPEPRLERMDETKRRTPEPQRFTDWVIRLENRDAILALLEYSKRPTVQEVLRCRQLTNTVVFPPSSSSSGQAMDAAISVTGMLLEQGHLSASLANAIVGLAAAANKGGDTHRLEQAFLDIMSLGQRFNWGQLVSFLAPIQDTETLRIIVSQIRRHEDKVPVIYAAIELSEKPKAVADYLAAFSRTGMQDLGNGLQYGAGGVNELLKRKKRLYVSNTMLPLAGNAAFGTVIQMAADFGWRTPSLAIALKWTIYILAGCFLAGALHFCWRISALEQPLQVRGFHFAREFLFGLGFLLVVLLVSEPFLSQDSQKVDFPFRLRLPTVGSAVPAQTTASHSSLMNQLSLLTLLLFFVLQALIYTACVIKLAEIRRQRVPARIKLKLLENEDHLFDAGLYLGFVGTIISLILVSLGVIKPSLMAAYSSTSFGIIFVSFFKIFHLRSLRRKLLLEAESNLEAAAPGARYSATVS